MRSANGLEFEGGDVGGFFSDAKIRVNATPHPSQNKPSINVEGLEAIVAGVRASPLEATRFGVAFQGTDKFIAPPASANALLFRSHGSVLARGQLEHPINLSRLPAPRVQVVSDL